MEPILEVTGLVKLTARGASSMEFEVFPVNRRPAGSNAPEDHQFPHDLRHDRANAGLVRLAGRDVTDWPMYRRAGRR